MRRLDFAVVLAFFVSPVFSGPIPGHHLPTGMEQAVRERQVDITRLAADLRVDFNRQTLDGSVTIAFTPLQAELDTLIFDAVDLDINEVELVGAESGIELDFLIVDRMLQIALPAGLTPDVDLAVRISYKARPNTGLYFFAESKTRTAEAWNYGEGGRHYKLVAAI